MSDDIVERLRYPDDDKEWSPMGLCSIAADEIERLRAALDEANLAYIEASNPGIDIERVRRERSGEATDE